MGNLKNTNMKPGDPFLRLTDSEILLNYSEFLVHAYPFLMKIDAACYNLFDDFCYATFYEMVYKVFADKYQKKITYEETHKYGMTLHSYIKISHIEVLPKIVPFIVTNMDNEIVIDEKMMRNNAIVFKSFGNGINWLSGSIEKEDLANVNFSKAEIELFEKTSGLRYRKYKDCCFWINKDQVDYVFVSEEYDRDEHKYYKDIYVD